MEEHIEINGVEETIASLRQIRQELSSTPIEQAMEAATLVVARAAREYAPVDQGRLRASILPEVRSLSGERVEGIVGSNVMYAPFVELGTRPHWPPLEALRIWAARHGLSAFLVARAIARRGTKAIRFLQRGVEEQRQRVEDILEQAVKGIIR